MARCARRERSTPQATRGELGLGRGDAREGNSVWSWPCLAPSGRTPCRAPRRGPVASEMNCWAFVGSWCAAGFMPCAFKGVGVVLRLNFGTFMGRGARYALLCLLGKWVSVRILGGGLFTPSYVCSENVYLFAQEWKRHINLL